MTVGRSRKSDIQLDSVYLSPKHLVFTTSSKGFSVKPYSKNCPVTVNQKNIKKEVFIENTDSIEAGNYQFMYHANAAASQYAEHPTAKNISIAPAYIQLLNGNDVGKIIPMRKPLIRVGVKNSNYAMIARREEGYFLSHIEGDKPPRVDNQYIDENSSYLLSDDNVIEIGSHRLLFHCNLPEADS